MAGRLLAMAPDRLGETAAKLAMLGWICGMAYYNWVSTYPLSVPWWAHLTLMTGGLYGVSVTIGEGVALLAGLAARTAGGRLHGRLEVVLGVVLLVPALAFLAARCGLLLFHFAAR
ncbi:hypothetical protein QO011_007111 [Labrys wisconsinensis]|uniref:Uncharacterized protein n=2 Tax=Labrys wisconsinensis TaxID=425677 RepID=A0ABU0JII1_9HYPH|nr:hypothetical protein [Labrys wisconsinensis]